MLISCCDGGDALSGGPIELLAHVPVLSTLVPEDLERIAQVAVPREFEPGQVVFREGDASDTCYIVRIGPRPGGARARGRPHDHARDVRPGRHLR